VATFQQLRGLAAADMPSGHWWLVKKALYWVVIQGRIAVYNGFGSIKIFMTLNGIKVSTKL